MVKSKLTEAFLFVLIFALLALGLDRGLRSGLRLIEEPPFVLMNQVFGGQIRADILIQGSSRAMVHFDPAVVREATGLSCYNAGINGWHADMQLAALKVYLRRNPAPKWIVQEVGWDTLLLQKPFTPEQFIGHLGDPGIFSALARTSPEFRRWRAFPLYPFAVLGPGKTFRWAGQIAERMFRPSRVYSAHPDGAYDPHDEPWDGKFDELKKQYPKGMRCDIDTRQIRALEEIVRLCRENNIELVFVQSPLYWEVPRYLWDHGRIMKILRMTADQNGVPFWDYAGFFGQARRYFYNGLHLNREGAEIFCRDFARQLARLISETRLSSNRFREM